MSKYGRLLVRHFLVFFGGIGVPFLFFFGLFGVACHQNTDWNCDIPGYLAGLAADPAMIAFIFFLLALPWWSHALKLTDRGLHLVARILLSIFGFLFAAAIWVGLFAVYLMFLR